MLTFLSLAVLVVVTEMAFRATYFKIHGRRYHVSIKFKWEDSHVVTHPFLSFAYKRNHTISKNQPLPYELHPYRYYSFKQPLRLNNLGHFGDDFRAERDPETIRIACLGASTTANNISDGEKDYTYPSLLSEMLSGRLDQLEKKVEVLNCGIGGWVSADILINFCLNIVHLRPDYIILYHGYNDLQLGLQPGFCTDYSHGRRNLAEVLHLIKRAYYLPKIPFLTFYEFLKDRYLGTGNIRNDVLAMITINQPNYDSPFLGLDAEQENIRSLLAICRHHNIRVVLSSFCMFQHNDSAEQKKLKDGVRLQNAGTRRLANEFDAIFVDQAELMPENLSFFVDALHFTPEGMRLLAHNFAHAIYDDIARRQ